MTWGLRLFPAKSKVLSWRSIGQAYRCTLHARTMLVLLLLLTDFEYLRLTITHFPMFQDSYYSIPGPISELSTLLQKAFIFKVPKLAKLNTVLLRI